MGFLVGAAAGAGGYHLYTTGQLDGIIPGVSSGPDLAAVRADVVKIFEDDDNLAPTIVRLGWHASGTFDPSGAVRGGSNGATMRFDPEASDGANAGLSGVRDALERVHDKHASMSRADLWTFAAKVAIEEMGGPEIPWRAGRKDLAPSEASEKTVPPNGRLPDATKGASHIRDLFVDRMGFTERETVALIGGGHAIGRCHKEASGFHGPWTRAPTTFSNMYFTELLGQDWVEVTLDNGVKQFMDRPTKEIMMLPADMELRNDPAFRKISEEYASDSEVFFKDFAAAFGKLLELGCEF